MAFKTTDAGVLLGLVVSSAGAAIPFGFTAGPHHSTVTGFEWVLTGLFALAMVGIVVGRSHALLLAAAAWTTTGLYEGALDPGETWRWRVGFTLVCLGIGTVAWSAYAREAGRGQ